MDRLQDGDWRELDRFLDQVDRSRLREVSAGVGRFHAPVQLLAMEAVRRMECWRPPGAAVRRFTPATLAHALAANGTFYPPMVSPNTCGTAAQYGHWDYCRAVRDHPSTAHMTESGMALMYMNGGPVDEFEWPDRLTRWEPEPLEDPPDPRWLALGGPEGEVTILSTHSPDATSWSGDPSSVCGATIGWHGAPTLHAAMYPGWRSVFSRRVVIHVAEGAERLFVLSRGGLARFELRDCTAYLCILTCGGPHRLVDVTPDLCVPLDAMRVGAGIVTSSTGPDPTVSVDWHADSPHGHVVTRHLVARDGMVSDGRWYTPEGSY